MSEKSYTIKILPKRRNNINTNALTLNFLIRYTGGTIKAEKWNKEAVNTRIQNFVFSPFAKKTRAKEQIATDNP